ncbi:MAG TPA: transglycosylase family protein, partial [Acidimicrobiales bacterium]|nr:transglycosylase family protein [Acidimicrobiales bacterium]
ARRAWRARASIVFVGATLVASVVQQAVAGGGTLEGKRAEAARLTNELESQARRVVELDRRHRQARARVAELEGMVRHAEGGVRSAMAQQDEARRRLQVQAVEAYMRGGSFTVIGKLKAGTALPLYDTYLTVAAGYDRNAIERFRGARQDLEARRHALELVLGRARSEAARLRSDRAALDAAAAAQRSRVAQLNGEVASLVAAEQRRRAALAAAATPTIQAQSVSPSPRPASPAAPLLRKAPAPASDPFACIRQLESGGNYRDPNGGAYQFQDATWQSLGYSGSAEDAPPAVQDEAARKLQARDGWDPWTVAPSCGLV